MTFWLYTSGIITAMQTYALLWFLSHLFNERFRLPLKPITYLVLDATACLMINLMCVWINDSHMAYSFIYTISAQFLLCELLFSGNGYLKFFYILFSNVYFAGVLMLCIFIQTALIPREVLSPPIIYTLVVNIIPQSIAIVALIPFQRYMLRRKFFLSPPRFYWFFIYCVYGAIYFGTVYITDALVLRDLVTITSIALQVSFLLVTIAFYMMFLSICNSYHEKIQHSLIEQQYMLQRAHFSEIQTANQALRELRHELKNYMFYMNYLIDQGNFEKLHQFFSEFYRKEHRNLYEISGSDSFLDAVLQQKMTSARAQGVEVTEHVLLSDDGTLNNLDLCIVLSNLIDNAVEACRTLKYPAIEIRLKRVKDYVSVVVENTSDQNVLKQNPMLQTGKGDRELHGIGLRVIRQIVERYDGTIEFDSDDTSFKAMLMMKIPIQTQKESEEAQ